MKRLGSEKDIHFESGLFKPKLWSRQIFKKGMAYFLCFVLLVGSMQGISCAEGNLEEIAERIESEEPQSVSHDSENEQSVSSEEGISSGNEEEAGNQAENGENIAEDRPEEIGAEDGSEENSEAGESGLSEEEAQKKKAVYMDAGSFSEQADHDLTVTAIFGDKTFFEGTTMKVEVLEEESIIQEAKAALEAQYRKEDAKKEAKAEEKEAKAKEKEAKEKLKEEKIESKDEKGEVEEAKEVKGVEEVEEKEEPEIEVLEVVDISFYREIDGVEKEVQPKNGKKVEIRLEKTEKIKEVLEEDGKEELIGEDAEDSNTQEESSETREAQSKAEEAEGKNEGKKVEEKVTDSELAKTGSGEITYLGLLESDPYLKTVEQYLQGDQSTRPGLLARTLSASDLVHYENLLTLTTSLIDKASVNSGNLKTMLIGESYLESLKENNQEIYTKLHVLQDIELAVTPKTVEVTKNDSLDSPFTVYISGIDNRDHTLPFAARSDVNLIMVFNPKKHKILILNTPRDFYVPLAMNGKLDKLTHAGLYGVNESIHTLENFYGIKFNYYARINFDATSSVIDQLGGVDVTIPYVVNTYHGRRHYEPGTYHLNGDQALDFARERVSISWAGGDRERGRNQEKILSAMLHKLQTSPNDLNRIDQIFASIAKNIQTNFTSDDLKYLVQRQLTTLASWQTELIDVDGKADITSTFTYPEPKHFVWHPYQDSVDRAKAKLQEYLQN